MEINEKFIKIGKLPVSVPMKLGGYTQVKVSGEDEAHHLECVKIEQKNNQDGTYDEIYVLKQT